MFGLLKKLFGGKPVEATQPEAAPYKAEAPVVTEVVEAPKTEVAPASKPSSKKKPAGKKPAGQKAAQKPAAPKQGGAKKGGRKPKSKPAV